MNTILLAILFLLGNTNTQHVKPGTVLPTGWYYIIEEDNGFKKQLDKTENYYFVDPNPIITAKNIRKIEFRTDNEGKAYLAMQFNSAGTKAWAVATARSRGKRLGFILNDKLIQAPYVNSQITGGIAAIWDYSRAELELIKKAIQKKE